MKIIHIQPSLPTYRRPFFAAVDRAFPGQLVVYYSPMDMGSLTQTQDGASWAVAIGPIRRIFMGLYWQDGAVRVPIRRGDIVVISGAPRFLSNLVLLVRAQLSGARTVWWGHYWSSTSRRWRFFLRRQLMRLADVLLFYTDAEVQQFQEQNLSDNRVITALNNGIDSSSIVNLRQAYVAARRDRAFLFIGRLTEKANLSLLLNAMTHPETAGITLHVLGDGDMRPSLVAQAEKLGLSERVVWHDGTTDENRIAAVANQCRAFVYPGEVGLSLIHAMAYGLPCLVHNDPTKHMPEISAFEPDGTGHTFYYGDSESLALAMAHMIDRDDNLARWSARALEIVSEGYNTNSMAARFINLVSVLK